MGYPRKSHDSDVSTDDERELFESGTHSRLTTRPSPGDRRRVSNLHDDELDLAGGVGLRSTVPPSDALTSLDTPLLLPEHLFHQRLDDLARRIEMLTALLQTNGLTRAQGSRALQAALAAVAANAEEAHVESLGALARSLKSAVGELVADTSVDSKDALDVIVLDASEISRDLVALAVEAEGHIVRSAQNYDELVTLLGERLPDLVVAEISDGRTPARQFCTSLAALLESSPARLVIFSALPPSTFTELQRLACATAIVSKELGLPMLLAELESFVAEPPSRSRRS
jgi:CheY-like chemotaxis protein